VPTHLPPDQLPRRLAQFGANRAETRIMPPHLSTAAEFSALGRGELDVGPIRERPVGEEFDAATSPEKR
jgi:hypothetical protein